MGFIYLDPSSWVKHSALDTLQEESAEHAQMLMVSSDHRLLRAAQHEGLHTFDPETGNTIALQVLLGLDTS